MKKIYSVEHLENKNEKNITNSNIADFFWVITSRQTAAICLSFMTVSEEIKKMHFQIK